MYAYSEFMSGEPMAELEVFKWNTLGDAVFEDVRGIWEPLWSLRGDGRIEGIPEGNRAIAAERVLRELYADSLIYFFRVEPPDDVERAAANADARLTPTEVDEALGGDWWRQVNGLPEDHPSIWFGATPAGESACENPPPHISQVWRGDDTP